MQAWILKMSAKCFNNLSELPASWIPPSIHLSYSNLFFSLHLYCWQAVGLRWKWSLKFHWLCRCFLLTPKLLPNLEYTEACTILNVMNGPYIEEAASGMFPCIHDQLFKKPLVLRVLWSIGSVSKFLGFFPSSIEWNGVVLQCFVLWICAVWKDGVSWAVLSQTAAHWLFPQTWGAE